MAGSRFPGRFWDAPCFAPGVRRVLVEYPVMVPLLGCAAAGTEAERHFEHQHAFFTSTQRQQVWFGPWLGPRFVDRFVHSLVHSLARRDCI
ncbi:MAG: hypothetical protein KatS3mg111_2190 [Pirellulaceae bacterium]|nr:MAG: hypothetical protein KatS3mg111_2190 [Pirellulaceae bacterium]